MSYRTRYNIRYGIGIFLVSFFLYWNFVDDTNPNRDAYAMLLLVTNIIYFVFMLAFDLLEGLSAKHVAEEAVRKAIVASSTRNAGNP